MRKNAIHRKPLRKGLELDLATNEAVLELRGALIERAASLRAKNAPQSEASRRLAEGRHCRAIDRVLRARDALDEMLLEGAT